MKPVHVFDREKLALNLAKLKKGGENFEVVINPDTIMDFKNKKLSDVRDAILYEKIFYDAKKGLEASHDHIKSLFNTEDVLVVAKIILDHGEIQFTQEYREQKRVEKRNRILDIIVRNAVDPTTGYPHPRTRIEAALEEAKVRVDERMEAEDQIDGIVSKLKPILPIKLAIRDIELIIPATYAGKAYSTVERYGKIISDKWNSDGSWLCVVEMPAGLQNDFFDSLNKLTHGNVESRIVKEK